MSAPFSFHERGTESQSRSKIEVDRRRTDWQYSAPDDYRGLFDFLLKLDSKTATLDRKMSRARIFRPRVAQQPYSIWLDKFNLRYW